jgi:ATP-binding cassette subfamily B (MDR/TAP) protein 8
VSKSSGHAEETLSNIRTVRAFAMENEELERYTQDIELAKKLNIELGAGIGLFQGGSSIFLNGIVLSVLYTGGKLIASHSITSGDLMSFLVAAQTIQRSLSNLSLLFGQFVRGMGAGGRVFQYINLPTSYELTAGHNVYLGDRLEEVKGEIEFHNIWFRYPTRSGEYVLKRFSLQVPKGKVVAVVGPSGSGKSTLVNLLEG